MIGATATSQGANGLVPAPGMGQQDLFLRGDGTWAAPTGSAVDLQADGKTIEVFDEITLSLKDFGQQYYKYIVASGSEEEGNYVAAHYELQIVDDSNPWKEGLEPKVVKENGQLVLGWFEPNTTTLEGLQDQVVILSTAVSDLNSLLTNNYYTKEETDNLIAAELAKVDHLSRKVFDSIEDAEFFISAEEHPEQYIYMILASATGQSEQDKYDEYMYLDGALEKVGSWETDLSDYAKKTDLDNYVEKIDGYSLISIANIEKLEGIEAGAQKNLFDSINVNDFFIDENRQLNLQPLLISDIENLENILNTQSEDINSLNTEITNLNELIVNNYVLKTEYEEDISIIMSSLVWQSLTEE